jgi:hypothetical protein
MWKKIVSYIAAAFTIIAAFIFSGRINRQRLSKDNDSIDRIRDGVRDAEKNNRDIASGIEAATKLTDDISTNNRTAINRLRTAREILERAKKTADDKKNT